MLKSGDPPVEYLGHDGGEAVGGGDDGLNVRPDGNLDGVSGASKGGDFGVQAENVDTSTEL